MQIRLFPNSGHQFYDIPLAELLPGKDEDFIEQLAKKNRGPWKNWQGTPWLLYQYIFETGGTPLLKLAVETNLGQPSRGILFDFELDTVDEMPDEDDILEVYSAREEADIEDGENYQNRVLRLKTLPNKDGIALDIDLQLYWVLRGGWDPVDVDLVVDLGNTRSLALLLESPGQDSVSLDFGRRISILRFLPRGTPYSLEIDSAGKGVLADDCAIIDSWLLLHRPQFHHLEPQESKVKGERVTRNKLSEHYTPVGNPGDADLSYRKEYYLPHTFVELSPALIGGGRSHPNGVFKKLADLPLDKDARFAISSPKRYAWDEEPLGHGGGTFWKQIPNLGDPALPDYFDQFKSLIRFFMDPSGVDWDIDNPPSSDDGGLTLPSIKAEAEYPRRDAICWFALSILEAAHRQINSENYLIKMGRETLPRRLRSVRVTYPAGWICEEREKYLAQWQRAINLFTLSRFENHAPVHPVRANAGGSRPLLENDGMDEAVCSQMPVIYADVQALGSVQAWLDLFGKENRVNVMNVDIGGGTTDLSIIQYSMSGNTDSWKQEILDTKLLFRDGYSVAGDALVKRLIEQILIPSWINASCKDSMRSVPRSSFFLRHFFGDPSHPEFATVDPKAGNKLMRITRLVFIPIVNQWLQQLGEMDSNPDHSWEGISIDKLLRTNYIDKNALNDLNELTLKLISKKCDKSDLWEGNVFNSEGVILHAQIEQINRIIDEVFKEHFVRLGFVAGSFDCDVVMVSGKPSELPRIRELIAEFFPIIPQRIIHLKNFPAGDWYPFCSFGEGRIADAKTCTVVGAALFQDMRNGNCAALSIRKSEDVELSRRYYWGLVTKDKDPKEFHRAYLFDPSVYPEAPEGAELIKSSAKTFDLPVNCRIGRQLVRMPNVRAEPVYQLRWSPQNSAVKHSALVKVTLRWFSARGRGEWLECERIATHPDYPQVDPDEVSFRLNTLFEESFWLDEPKFTLPDAF